MTKTAVPLLANVQVNEGFFNWQGRGNNWDDDTGPAEGGKPGGVQQLKSHIAPGVLDRLRALALEACARFR